MPFLQWRMWQSFELILGHDSAIFLGFRILRNEHLCGCENIFSARDIFHLTKPKHNLQGIPSHADPRQYNRAWKRGSSSRKEPTFNIVHHLEAI